MELNTADSVVKKVNLNERVEPSLADYVSLAIGILTIGAAAVFARFALSGSGPVMVSALRLSIATFPLVLYSFWKPGPKVSREQEILLGIAGLALAAHFACWIGSLQYISVATSTLLVCTTPLWNALYETWVLKQAPKKVYWLALVFAAVGLVLITQYSSPIHGHVPPLGDFGNLGIPLAILGSWLIGLYLILIDRVGKALPTRSMITRTYFWASVSLSVLAAFQHEAIPPVSNTVVWGGILAMALISHSIGNTLLTAAVKTFSPSKVSFAVLLEPILASLFAALVFGEYLSSQSIGGGILVLLAVGLALK